MGIWDRLVKVGQTVQDNIWNPNLLCLNFSLVKVAVTLKVAVDYRDLDKTNYSCINIIVEANYNLKHEYAK